jgi:hypothetical protein
MELSSLSKMEALDSPERGTNRTIKPEDRCVISYNFEQNGSSNYTHNLLIGMFNDPTKKIVRAGLRTSLEQGKNKITAVAPQSKKVVRQDPNTIAKVYDSNVPARLYINAISPKRDNPQGISSHLAASHT